MVEIEKNELIFRAKPYEWELGIGVEIEIFRDNNKVGCARLLSAEHENNFNEIRDMEQELLLRRALEGFILNKIKTSAGKVIDCQAQLREMGFKNVSPIYGNLSTCF